MKTYLSIFLTGVFLYLPSAFAKPACIASGSHDGLATAEKQADYAAREMGDFCERNMILRYLNSVDQAPENCESLPLDKLESYTDSRSAQLADPEKFSKIWQNVLISTPKSREISYRSTLSAMAGSELIKLTDEDARKLFLFDRAGVIANKGIEGLGQPSADQTNSSNVIQVYKDKALKLGLCLKESFSDVSTCNAGLDYLEAKTKVTSYNGVKFTNVDVWKKVLKNSPLSHESYDKGVRLAALKIANHMLGDLRAEDNILDDLIESFVLSRKTRQEAIDAAWDVLALVSNGGQNTSARVVTIESSQRGRALTYISNAMTFLDLKKRQKNLSPYSFPKAVSTGCDNGKSYHFWMTAYLARDLVKTAGLTVDDAAKISFLANKAYQVSRGDLNAEIKSKNAVFTRQNFDPSHQIIRADIAFAAAGAVFGADSLGEQSNKKLNIDGSIVSMILNSGSLDPITRLEAEKLSRSDSYFRFLKIFNPDTAFEALYK